MNINLLRSDVVSIGVLRSEMHSGLFCIFQLAGKPFQVISWLSVHVISYRITFGFFLTGTIMIFLYAAKTAVPMSR